MMRERNEIEAEMELASKIERDRLYGEILLDMRDLLFEIALRSPDKRSVDKYQK